VPASREHDDISVRAKIFAKDEKMVVTLCGLPEIYGSLTVFLER
jgi:hypothetical protein